MIAEAWVLQRRSRSVYAYEVDGKGNVLTCFDDANVPPWRSRSASRWWRRATTRCTSRSTSTRGGRTREWFEWSNALFVVLWVSSTVERCDAHSCDHVLQSQVPTRNAEGDMQQGEVCMDPHSNDRRDPLFHQGVSPLVPYGK
jgi:Metal-independent alpha-mannosidase (GH125)